MPRNLRLLADSVPSWCVIGLTNRMSRCLHLRAYLRNYSEIAIALIDPCYCPGMPRATIIVDVTHPEEVTASEEWFAKWTASLTYRSEDKGCGCCVHIWDVEGAEDALLALPPGIRAWSSEWADGGASKS
jgi:hypothetical protein